VGQQHITDTLRRQVLLGRLSHAYLFTGTRGTGKTTCARLLAMAVNCENPVGGEPCGKCASCRGIEQGSVLDVMEIDAASNNGVDNIRSLREDAVYTPAAVKMRVYIIDEVHMLSTSAFNALLKILEEPPEHLMFILATTELHKVPATILSRCQRYSFKRISPEDIEERLMTVAKAEDIELTEDACALLAQLADGAMRDALSLLDQCSGDKVDRARVVSAIGVADSEELLRLYAAIRERDGKAAMETLDELYQNGRNVSAVLDRLAALYRDLLMVRLAPAGGSALLKSGFSAAELTRQAQGMDIPALLAGLETLDEAISGLRGSASRRLAAEICLLRLCDYSPTEGLTAFAVAPPSYAAPVPPVPAAPAEAAPAPVKGPAPAKPAPVAEAPVPEAPVYANRDDFPPYDPPEPFRDPEAPVLTVETPPPAPPTAEPEKSGALSWPAMLKLLKKRLDGYIYSILADPEQVAARFRGRELRLLCKNPFCITVIDDTETREAVEKAAAELFSGAWRVTAAEYSAEEDGEEPEEAAPFVPAEPEEPAETPPVETEAASAEAETESKLDRLMRRFDIKYNEGE
jgi:DNA polymerase-3 subunit gamma/tau